MQKRLNCLAVALEIDLQVSVMGNSKISFLYATITRAKGILLKKKKKKFTHFDFCSVIEKH